MKSLLTVSLEGIWDFTPNNEELVEVVGGTVSHFFRTLLEGFFSGLFGSFELHETYQKGDLWAKDKQLKVWEPGEEYGNKKKLRFSMYLRPGLFAKAELDAFQTILKDPTVFGLWQDYAAYRQALRNYRGVGFTREPDEVKLISIKFSANSVAISVSSDWNKKDFPSVPVLRASCNGESIILTPTQDGPYDHKTNMGYKGILPVNSKGQVWVYSNYGGIVSTDAQGNMVKVKT